MDIKGILVKMDFLVFRENQERKVNQDLMAYLGQLVCRAFQATMG